MKTYVTKTRERAFNIAGVLYNHLFFLLDEKASDTAGYGIYRPIEGSRYNYIGDRLECNFCDRPSVNVWIREG